MTRYALRDARAAPRARVVTARAGRNAAGEMARQMLIKMSRGRGRKKKGNSLHGSAVVGRVAGKCAPPPVPRAPPRGGGGHSRQPRSDVRREGQVVFIFVHARARRRLRPSRGRGARGGVGGKGRRAH